MTAGTWSTGTTDAFVVAASLRTVAVGARVVSRPWSEQPTTASTPTSTAGTPLLSDLDLM